MTIREGAPEAKIPWKSRALHHDAERFLRAPGCSNCIDKNLCGGLNTRTRLLDCMELCCGKPNGCTWVCRRNMQFKGQMQEIGGLRLDNISISGAVTPVALPPLVPLFYHGYRRVKPFEGEAVAVKLAQMFDKRDGSPRFGSREELCRSFRISPTSRIIISGVDQDPVIERWWGIGQAARQRVIEVLRTCDVALVTAPNFSLCLNWPRYGDMAAIKRIARTYAELANGGVAASLHVNGRTHADFTRWGELLLRVESISHISYEFSTGAAYGERRAQHIAWLSELARRVGRPLHLVVYGDTSVVRELAPSFASVVLIETTSFMKTLNRLQAVRLGNGKLDWEPKKTPIEQDLADLLTTNVEEVRAYHAMQLMV